MPRPVKQLAVLLFIRSFRFFLGSGRIVRSALIASGRMLLVITVRVGGPLYRWSHTARLFLHKKIRLLPTQPRFVVGTVVLLLLLIGLSDNWSHQDLELDPFGSRPLFMILDRIRSGEAERNEITQENQNLLSDHPQTTVISGQTAMLKPQILSSDSSRKTPTTYSVATGDTLSSIAERFDLNITTILWENKLSLSSTLRIGQELTILPVNGIRHTIKNGDTIESLAKRYNADAEKILTFNAIKSTAPLRLATDLIIPDGRPAYEPPAQPRTRLARIERFFTKKVTQPVKRLGQMLWPTPVRRLTQYFSWRHPGIDIKGAMGTPVYAAGEGTVTEAGWNRGGYGNQVILTHTDGKRTRYAHLSRISVKVAEGVRQGEVIGLVGSTGRSTGPHLHFEVIAGGRRLNPLGILR